MRLRLRERKFDGLCVFQPQQDEVKAEETKPESSGDSSAEVAEVTTPTEATPASPNTTISPDNKEAKKKDKVRRDSRTRSIVIRPRRSKNSMIRASTIVYFNEFSRRVTRHLITYCKRINIFTHSARVRVNADVPLFSRMSRDVVKSLRDYDVFPIFQKKKWSFRSISFSKKDKTKPSREDTPKNGDVTKEEPLAEVSRKTVDRLVSLEFLLFRL